MAFFIVSTATIVTAVSFRGSRDTAELLISAIMEDSRTRILEDTLDYIYEGSDSLEFLSGLVEASQLFAGANQGPAAQPEVLAGFLGEFLLENDQFLSAAVTGVVGTHVRAIRMEDGSLSYLAQSPRDGMVVSRFDHENPRYAERYPPARSVPVADAYQPQETEWYRDAVSSGTLVWTDARALDVIPTGGLTSAVPIYRGGQLVAVVSLDISLSEISSFLGSSPALNAVSFIADPQDDSIIAFSESSAVLVQAGDGQLINADDLPETPIPTALAELRPRLGELVGGGSVEFPLRFGGDIYLASFSQVPEETGWNWAIGILVPQEVFLDRIINNVLVTLAISGGVVLVGIGMSIVLARGVSRPLRRLSQDMQRIKEFELDESGDVASRLREVVDMSGSLEGMKAGLRSFRKYIPATLVRQLIHLGKEAELGGEQKRLAVFFSDIAGFTEVSERLEPGELVARLAEYLGALSDVIQRYQGTVDKYIGDAIMAFWGAPTELENPDLRAVEAALACQAEARRINEKWIAEGLDVEFHIRIGINTGDLIVGNMGSESRLNYTVIGDAVNLASRLEGANKPYGTRIMISESTYHAVSDSIACAIIDKVRVKGRTEPIMVYEPIGHRSELDEKSVEMLDLHNEAWNLYAESRFRDAALRFRSIYLKDKSNRLAALYFQRCAAHIKSPPGPGWDAVTGLKEK